MSNPSVAKANLLDLAFTLGETSASAAPVTVGTYGATMPNELTAGYDSYDATCNDTGGGEQTAGQVVLCSVGSTYTGTFDLTFGSDHVTGTFVAPSCTVTVTPPDAGAGAGDAGAVCEP